MRKLYHANHGVNGVTAPRFGILGKTGIYRILGSDNLSQTYQFQTYYCIWPHWKNRHPGNGRLKPCSFFKIGRKRWAYRVLF